MSEGRTLNHYPGNLSTGENIFRGDNLFVERCKQVSPTPRVVQQSSVDTNGRVYSCSVWVRAHPRPLITRPCAYQQVIADNVCPARTSAVAPDTYSRYA